MEFKDNTPIYRQIIDYCFGCVLSGGWKPDEKIPSVREMAVNMAVNTHTVLRAFEFLQSHDIIYPKRGMGFYLSANAQAHVDSIRRQEFFEEKLCDVFKEMQMLGIGMDDVVACWDKWLKAMEEGECP